MNGLAFRAAEFIYSGPRRVRNRLLNLIDRPIVTLLYHRIAALPSDPPQLAVTPENFRAQLNFLKQNFDIVRFGEDWSDVKKPSVSITFDDSYADNLLEALPILEEMQVPATFFVSTGIIGTTQEFWWDELERIVLGDWPFPKRFELDDDRFGEVWSTGTDIDRRTLYKEIYPLMKTSDALSRERWLDQLRRWAHAGEGSREINRAMTVEELQELGRSEYATIGAHTVTHASLSSLPVMEQKKEINISKKQLESWLGRDVSVFSYPFGDRCDYTQETIERCREAGFVKAAAAFPGQAHRWTDLFQIPRQAVRNWPVSHFSQQVRRFWVL